MYMAVAHVHNEVDMCEALCLILSITYRHMNMWAEMHMYTQLHRWIYSYTYPFI